MSQYTPNQPVQTQTSRGQEFTSTIDNNALDLLQQIVKLLEINNQYSLILVGSNNEIKESDVEVRS